MAKDVTRTVRITYKDTPEGHADRDQRITKINNFLFSKDESETYSFIFDLGIQTALQQIGGSGDMDAKMKAAIREKLLEISSRDNRWNELNKIYDKMPSDEFQKWCDDNLIPSALLNYLASKRLIETLTN